jgi:hypothetical protein
LASCLYFVILSFKSNHHMIICIACHWHPSMIVQAIRAQRHGRELPEQPAAGAPTARAGPGRPLPRSVSRLRQTPGLRAPERRRDRYASDESLTLTCLKIPVQ